MAARCERFPHFLGELVERHRQNDEHPFGASPEPLEMLGQAKRHAPVGANRLEHGIAVEKPAVEHAHEACPGRARRPSIITRVVM